MPRVNLERVTTTEKVLRTIGFMTGSLALSIGGLCVTFVGQSLKEDVDSLKHAHAKLDHLVSDYGCNPRLNDPHQNELIKTESGEIVPYLSSECVEANDTFARIDNLHSIIEDDIHKRKLFMTVVIGGAVLTTASSYTLEDNKA